MNVFKTHTNLFLKETKSLAVHSFPVAHGGAQPRRVSLAFLITLCSSDIEKLLLELPQNAEIIWCFIDPPKFDLTSLNLFSHERIHTLFQKVMTSIASSFNK